MADVAAVAPALDESMAYFRDTLGWLDRWATGAKTSERLSYLQEIWGRWGVPDEIIQAVKGGNIQPIRLRKQGSEVFAKIPRAVSKFGDLINQEKYKAWKEIIREQLKMARMETWQNPQRYAANIKGTLLKLLQGSGVEGEFLAAVKNVPVEAFGRVRSVEVLNALQQRPMQPGTIRFIADILKKPTAGRLGGDIANIVAHELGEEPVAASKAGKWFAGVAKKLPTEGKLGFVGKAVPTGVAEAGATTPGRAVVSKAAQAAIKGVTGTGKLAAAGGLIAKTGGMLAAPLTAVLTGFAAKSSFVDKPAQARALATSGRTAGGQPVRAIEELEALMQSDEAVAQRRATLGAREPNLMKQVIHHLAGRTAQGPLTSSERGTGMPTTGPSTRRSSAQVRYLLDKFLRELGEGPISG